MTVTLTFEVPEEQYELDAATHGGKYRDVLHQLAQVIRDHLKYDAPLTFENLQRIMHEELAGTGWLD